MPSERRKASAADLRFDSSNWLIDGVEAFNSRQKSSSTKSEKDEEEDEDAVNASEEDDAQGKGGATLVTTGPVVKPLTKQELELYDAKQGKKGIIYISRIPYGMTVAKVRHLLAGFGDVERVYLQDGKEKERGGKMIGRGSKSAHFTEGWVEFADKRVAKTVAEMLNAEPIGAASGGSGGGKGGKRAGGKMMRRWKDEMWTMKYLTGFKWGMLSEQLANERASRASRVRAELSQSAYEQKDYLRKVERARVMRLKDTRRLAGEEQYDRVRDNVTPGIVSGKRKNSFHQREAISRDIRDPTADEKVQLIDNAPAAKKQCFDTTPVPNIRSQALQGALSKIF